MIRHLSQPASHLIDWKSILLRYACIGLFIAFFLIVFQPFGTANVKFPNKSLFLSGYGWITFICLSLYQGGAYVLFPTIFTEEKWVVWKEALFLLIGLSIVFFASYAYKQLWFGQAISIADFLGFFPYAFSISIFPVAAVALLEYIFQLKRNQATATTFNQQIPTNIPTSNLQAISFKDENGKEDFSIPQNQLLFIKAANNYVEINYLEGDEVKMYLLRNSLSTIEQQLEIPAIKRCHRSYLVNIDKVGRITGNAQGYKLHFPFTSEYVVPVSRSKGKELLDLLKDSN